VKACSFLFFVELTFDLKCLLSKQAHCLVTQGGHSNTSFRSRAHPVGWQAQWPQTYSFRSAPDPHMPLPVQRSAEDLHKYVLTGEMQKTMNGDFSRHRTFLIPLRVTGLRDSEASTHLLTPRNASKSPRCSTMRRTSLHLFVEWGFFTLSRMPALRLE
jgi:hypothetical protein